MKKFDDKPKKYLKRMLKKISKNERLVDLLIFVAGSYSVHLLSNIH